MTKFTFTLIAVIALSTTVAFGGEWIIFSEELPPGADLALRADSQFVVSNSHPADTRIFSPLLMPPDCRKRGYVALE